MTGQVSGQGGDISITTFQSDQAEATEIRTAQQESKNLSALSDLEDNTNPMVFQKKQSTIEERKTKIQEKAAAGEKAAVAAVQEKADSGESEDTFKEDQETAEQFQKKNPQLESKNLLAIRREIRPESSAEDILRAINAKYPQPDLAVEALNFLLQIAKGKDKEKINGILQDYLQAHGDEIAQAKKIGGMVRGSTEEAYIRQMHQRITHEAPPDYKTLFNELSLKFPEAKNLSEVCRLLMRLAGEESKDGNIDHGKLYAIFNSIKLVQSVQQPMKYFERGLPRMEKEMREAGITEIPPQINPQSLAVALIELATDPYLNQAKITQTVQRLGLDSIREGGTMPDNETENKIMSIKAKIIVLSQMRDAIRQIAPKIFQRSSNEDTKTIYNRRDMVYEAILEALEDLEDQLEDLSEMVVEDES